MPKKWKIVSTTGGSPGADLIDCRLKETESGFEFEKPDKTKLSLTRGEMPTLPFSFPEFTYKDQSWVITVTGIDLGKDEKEATGRWRVPSPTNDEEGTWTGQAGGSGEEVESSKSAEV